jgi:acyl dehydratase
MILRVFSKFTDIRPSRSKPDMAVVTMRGETRNQHGEVVQVTIAKLVVYKRPAA